MPVYSYHRGEVAVPDNVYERFSEDPEYKRMVDRLADGAFSSGTETYAGVFEWAEYRTLRDAQDFCDRWHNYLLDLQGIIRSCP